jgi:hypothetical protein
VRTRTMSQGNYGTKVLVIFFSTEPPSLFNHLFRRAVTLSVSFLYKIPDTPDDLHVEHLRLYQLSLRKVII